MWHYASISILFNYHNSKFQDVLHRDSEERRRKKTLESEFPLWFNIKFIHNHEINRQDHKRLRTVSQETKLEFISLFEQDFTATAAWEQHRKKIQEQYPEDYAMKFGDRHLCPDYFWVFKFYRKWIQDTLGSYDGVDAYVKILQFVEEYNEKT